MTEDSRSKKDRGDQSWARVLLGEVADIERQAVTPEDVHRYQFYVGLENVTSNGEFRRVITAGEAALKSNKFAFDHSHVLYGKLRPYLAKIAAPTFTGICSTDILPIKPSARLNRRYLLHYLRMPEMVAYAASNAVGINLPRLSPKALESFEIPLPPIEEQRRIAAVLDAAYALRAKRREALAKHDTLTRAVFVDMFGDPNSRSMQSDSVPLRDLLKVKSGQGLPAKSMRPGSHLVYGGNGVSGTHDEYMFEESKIVIGRVGVYCGCVHVSEPESWVTDNALYVSWMSSRLRKTYLAVALDLVNLNRQASQAAQPLISGGRVYPVEIPVPPLHDQQVFEERARAIADHRSRLQTTAASLNELFASLQQMAFRGEL